MPRKRHRDRVAEQYGQASCEAATPGLLRLPIEVLQMVLNHLDSRSLVRMRAVCREFSSVCGPGGPMGSMQQQSMTEEAAKAVMLRLHNGNARLAGRWGGFTWLTRLRMEDTQSPIDTGAARGAGFTFTPRGCGQPGVKLTGAGPKLLVSKETTHTRDILHWRLELCSDSAVELGVIPADMQNKPSALHLCKSNKKNAEGDRPTGIRSSITMHSKLPTKVPLMKGSKIELVLQKDVLKILVKQPQGGQEPVLVKGKVQKIDYKGPPQMRLEFHYQYQGPARLAITCYQGADLLFPESQVLDLQTQVLDLGQATPAAAAAVGDENLGEPVPAAAAASDDDEEMQGP